MLVNSTMAYNVVFSIAGGPFGGVRGWGLNANNEKYIASIGGPASNISFESSVDYYLYIFD